MIGGFLFAPIKLLSCTKDDNIIQLCVFRIHKLKKSLPFYFKNVIKKLFQQGGCNFAIEDGRLSD